MQPLTMHVHKTLLPIAKDETILGRILGSLSAVGLTDVVIVTGYRAQDIRDFADRYSELNISYVHNSRYAETNNIYSLALAFTESDLSDGIVLIESDLIYEQRVLERLMKCDHENVALLDHYRAGMDGTVVRLSPDGVISSIIPGSQQDAGFSFADTYKTLNIYKFAGEFCRGTFSRLLRFYAQEVSDNCYYELIMGMLVTTGSARIHGEVLEGEAWAEVDDPADLNQARFIAEPSSRRSMLDNAWGGYWGLPILDFAFIRNLRFPTPAVIAELRLQLPELLDSYGSAQWVLDQKMSWYLRVDPTHVVALNGASQAFPWIRRVFGKSTVQVTTPTFGEWSSAFPNAITYPDSPDAPASVNRPLVNCDVVVIVNPNNPTGTTIPTREILKQARSTPGTTFLVDESFIEFSRQPSLVQLLQDEQLPNIVVVKSLSKSLGVPGARLGFVYSQDTLLLASLRTELPIWNMNSVAEKFLELLLKNRVELQRSFDQTITDREDLVSALGAASSISSTMPSGANFVLATLRTDSHGAQRWANELVAQHSIYVKDVSAKFGDGNGYWRIAVRTPADHKVFMAALHEVTRTGD